MVVKNEKLSPSPYASAIPKGISKRIDSNNNTFPKTFRTIL